MSRHARGLFTSGRSHLRHRVELRPRAEGAAVRLEIHRDDCQPGASAELALEEARALLRSLQAACDRADRAAYQEHKQLVELEQLERDLEGLP